MRPTMRAAYAAAALLCATSTAWALPQDGGQPDAGEWQPEEPAEGGDGGGGEQEATPTVSGGSSQPSSSSSSPSSSSSSSSSSSGSACNNSPDLCDRSYSNVTHMGAHNAAFLRDESTDNSIAGNHFFNATRALDAGLRLLSSQVHMEDGELHLCHSSCDLLDAGPLEDWLELINDWMDDNPNEVVTLILVNAADEDADAFGEAFEASGIDQFGYVPGDSGSSSSSSSSKKKHRRQDDGVEGDFGEVPPETDDGTEDAEEGSGGGGGSSAPSSWPTLQELIDDDTRLIAFVTSISSSNDHPYLLPQFDYVFETPFEVTSPSGFNCTLDRPSSQSSADAAIDDGMLPLMNHFLYQSITDDILVPNEEDIDDTNSPDTDEDGSLGAHAEQCAGEWDRAPTFVLVDFWDEGPAIDTADALNGVDDAEGRDENAATKESAAVALTGVSGTAAQTGALVAFIAAAVAFF